MQRTAVKPLVLVIFVLALSVRLFNLNLPFLEPFNNYSRQSMSASVARNFYDHGFNLFYPEIYENGNGPSLYNVEMPLYSYLMALGYQLAGGVHEWVARLVSVLFSMGFLIFLYLFVRHTADEATACWALVFAALSPMMVALSRSVQPDITMLFTGTAALYFFYLYHETGKISAYALSAASLFLAVLTRPFALYFLLPIIFLAWKREGFYFLRNGRHYLYAGFVLSALCWYFYMWKMGKDLDLAYQPYHYSSATDHFKILDYFLPQNLALPAKALFLHLLTPIGAFLGCLGIMKKGKAQRFFLVWLIATMIYLLLLWKTAVVHPYYFLPLSPPLAFFVGCGAERIRKDSGFWNKLKRPAVMLATSIFLIINLFYYYRLLYFVPDDRMAVVEAGKAMDSMIPKGALVVAAYHTSPIQLYYCHHRGWTFDLTEGDQESRVARLEALRKKGAEFFVTTELGAIASQPVLKDYLSRYPLKKIEDRFEIWRLNGEGS